MNNQPTATTTKNFNHRKYAPAPAINLSDRSWPDSTIKQAPIWCSVDLRDGNQALIEPMSVEQKCTLFSLLVEIGFKQIEVGFPAASQPDFDFVRRLIDENRIPDDVTIQVLTQARETLINKTFEALEGVGSAIVHLYNSTSKIQREHVFKSDKAGITEIAITGATLVKACAEKYPQTQWAFEYSPESFTNTEVDFAVEICDAVNQVWQPTPENPVIINLPSTVEVTTPNVYADQIEWFCRHIKNRESIIISLHTHNDRGCAVAAAELGVMAGADRVEGTLMGNGERTGNMDIVTMAMNLYSQGINPELDLSDMNRIIQTVEQTTAISVHPRHPYAGELVYTAFSGSHQDAIRKCMGLYDANEPWEVAYLPIDPRDLGRNYEEIIRINSQSGKGGVAYLLEQQSGLQLPRWLQIEFSQVVQKESENMGGEIDANAIWNLFDQTYLNRKNGLTVDNFQLNNNQLQATLIFGDNSESNSGNQTFQISGSGNGLLESAVNGLQQRFETPIEILEYSEHALNHGTESKAIAYIKIRSGQQYSCGVAIHQDVLRSSINALLSAACPILMHQTVAPA
ncbi:MAG: 2-isopropylmalate synthase [Pseudomonadales bacterium]|nr:2-isopropylmalate synthase [Pseudomonadales bacterium]